MKAIFIFIMSFFVSVGSMAQDTNFSIEADLHRLDSVVANSDNYEKQKLQDINHHL